MSTRVWVRVLVAAAIRSAVVVVVVVLVVVGGHRARVRGDEDARPVGFQLVGDPCGEVAHVVRLAEAPRENRASVASGSAVGEHPGDVAADKWSKVGLVDDEQIGPRDAGTALARDVVATGAVQDEI